MRTSSRELIASTRTGIVGRLLFASMTSMMLGERRNLVALSMTVASALLTSCPSAFALTPTLDVSQYAHTAWTVADGFTKGAIHSIAQTTDGYLWLGTEFGLLRFDGVRNTPWPADRVLPSNQIRTLLTGRDGTLWIGTSKGLASWKNGKLTGYAQLAGQIVLSMLEDRDGAVWVHGTTPPTGKLCAIRNGGVRCWGEDERFGSRVTTMYEDRQGNLWFGEPHGVWQWRDGHREFYPLASDKFVDALTEDADGVLLVLLSGRIYRMVDGKVREAYRLPGAIERATSLRVLRERDGGLWIGTVGGGLAHLHKGTIDQFSRSDGLSSDSIGALFQDREGNIWVGTHAGLDRFREFPVTPFTMRQGFSSLRVLAVVASTDGSIWVRTVDGLNQWKSGQVKAYRELADLSDPTRPRRTPPATGDTADNARSFGSSGGSLFQDERGRMWVSAARSVGYIDHDRFIAVRSVPGGRVHSITGDLKGTLWFAHQTQGLFRLADQHLVEQISWARLGHADFADALAADPATGGVWLGYFRGGVDFVKDGQVRASYAAADGFAAGRVNDLRFGRDGALWAAAEGGVSRLKNGRVMTLSSRDGLPCTEAHWTIEDDEGDFWLYMPCGLVRIARNELDAWARVADARRDRPPTIRVRVFDSSDGVRSRANAGPFSPHVAKAPDGRLWFFPLEGLSVVDPHHLSFNKIPPPVQIERMNADGHMYLPASEVRLPPLIRDLGIDYTALSFVAPEKVMFRIKLEGRDRDWQDVGNRRQAFYTNLSPGRYRFRVMASNNDGVWNEAGAAVDFLIAPAYYQTTWFRAASLAVTLALLWTLYQWRVRQLAHEIDARLQERLNERTRIARDLHDTLLQSCHGILFSFQGAANVLPDRPLEAKQRLEAAIERGTRAISEARDAVEGLRAATKSTNDLAVALSTLGEELAATQVQDAHTEPAELDVAIHGTPRNLHPIIRDDINRIGGEALRNAFRHARAQRIELEIRYDDRQLQLRVRDDGKGIDEAVLDGQSPGHFGLPGMRERAELVGGHFEVWSKVGVGTEVALTIPAVAAYAAPLERRRFWFSVSGGRGNS